ncbi:VWA domain-containing protein [Pseudomonas sp. 148P]|uniref:VWA domain-containing protein n=1 Tax=Pseudomonas ulcerans TaxID=3115852 RepID=A0ABU7HWY7_9PSED|nr:MULTISPECIES: VWA domain-containing protein [unclassified Pseudomonas]MEE1924389.1 VWA domain-containing protein [Pseudomonas sp. 147P]MEE1936060.1 VWA domain-containing protein [Pseudomonas sp. 148P]
MGRDASPAGSGGGPARGTDLAKKALSIRARASADARPKAGRLAQGPRGRGRAAGQGRLDWPATLLQGRPRQREDLRWQQRSAESPELWLVIVDASASTRRHQALSRAKGVLASFFDQAYRARARVALLTASGNAPRWQRHGLKASAALQPWLGSLGAGGGTPLLAALEEAREWLLRRQRQFPGERQRCLVLTDGRLRMEKRVLALPCETLLIDMERSPIRLGRARQLADELQSDYRHIDELPAR